MKLYSDFSLKYLTVLVNLLGLSFYCLAIDDDGNGISDVFEQQHGGSLDPSDDADADGFSNFSEYLLGGNPLLAGDLA